MRMKRTNDEHRHEVKIMHPLEPLTPQEVQLAAPAAVSLSCAGTLRVIAFPTFTRIAGPLQMPNLPSTDPGAASQRLWYDPTDGNRVKYSP